MMSTNFFTRIEQTLRARSEQVCLVWPGVAGQPAIAHTGATVLEQVRQIQLRLRAQGLAPGQPLWLLLPVGPPLVAALLAVMALGAVPMLPPAGGSGLSLLRLIRGSGRRVLALEQPLPRRWLARLLGLKLFAITRGDAPAKEPLLVQPVAPELPALVSHSSGSTGRPKAIRRGHAVLQAQHEALRAAFPPWVGQRDFPLFPNIILHNLAVGAVSILPAVPAGRRAQPDMARIVAQLQAEEVETLTGNVFYFQRLLDHLRRQPASFPAVLAVGVGGSPVPEKLLPALRTSFPRAKVFVIYGSSEAEPIAIREVAAASLDPRLGYVVGPPRPELKCRLGGPLTPLQLPGGGHTEAGEIQVRGAHVAASSSGWLATGDVGYFDAQGRLVLTARHGNDTAHGGVQHYQLEHLLHQLSGVARAAAKSTRKGFVVYVQGAVQSGTVWRALMDAFPRVPILGVHHRRELPVDARHLSKILYHRLS
jgi:acyl-CoA synthetase (AMP-forming)/AMP-acid ligase II